MSQLDETATPARSDGWETWRCATPSCREDLLHLARPAPGEATWLIYERPGWVIAASRPVCPGCAGTLTRADRAAHGTQVAAGALAASSPGATTSRAHSESSRTRNHPVTRR